VLAGLDARRAAAFATRDPALLADVYASASLLARDRAQLLAIVPAGCVLRGVRTRFSRLVIGARTGDQARLRVRSRVAASILVCGGRPAGRAAGTRAVDLEVVLLRTGSRYRIADQRQM
jgi:hypothetical protein